MVKTRKVEVRDTELNIKTDTLTCIAGICFQPDGVIKVTIPRDADPRCAKETASRILKGAKVQFEIQSSQLDKK